MASMQRGQAIARSLWRPFYIALGLLFVAMGIIGVFLPVWPTTVFLIMAVWAFKRSSPPLESWLLNHRVFGRTLRDWEDNHSMRRGPKVIAVTSIWLCLAISCALTHKPFVWTILLLVGIGVTVYLWTRPTAPE